MYSGATIGASGGSPSYTFAVTTGSLPTGLTLASGSGISGTPTVTGNPSFTITATDANSCTGSAGYTLAVGCPTITLSPLTLPAATTGTAYSQTITQTGGVGSGSFAVTSGSLPNGLSLAGGGALTGTPTVSGSSNFTVTFTDANGCTGSRSYSISVEGWSFYTLPPCRVLDTRNATGPYGGPALTSGATRSFLFAGVCGIPATAHAISINLTAVGPTAGGSLNVYGAALVVAPGMSALSYRMGSTRANNAIVALLDDGASHDVKISNSTPATVDVVVDVNGYFQ